MLKEFIQKSWLALVSALCFGLLVAMVNMVLADKISQNQVNKRNTNLARLFGLDSTFEAVSKTGGTEPDYFIAREGDNITGYAIVWSGAGFVENIDLLVGFDAELEQIKGFEVMKSAETPGFGDQIILHEEGKVDPVKYFKDRFFNKPISRKLVRAEDSRPENHLENEQIVTITGSTVTSEAVITIVNGAKAQLARLLEE